MSREQVPKRMQWLRMQEKQIETGTAEAGGSWKKISRREGLIWV